MREGAGLSMYSQIFNVVSPIFIMTFVGYVLGRTHRDIDTRSISTIVLLVATPCLIFSTLTSLRIDTGLLFKMALAAGTWCRVGDGWGAGADCFRPSSCGGILGVCALRSAPVSCSHSPCCQVSPRPHLLVFARAARRGASGGGRRRARRQGLRDRWFSR